MLDTSVASVSWDRESNRHEGVRRRLAGLGQSIVYVSAISIAEVEYGLRVAPKIDSGRQSMVRDAMASYRVLDVDQHTAVVYGEIRANLFRTFAAKDRQGRMSTKRVEDLIDRTTSKELGIQENDLWIVSVAVQYNLNFVTKDRMHRVICAAGYSKRTKYWN